MTQSTDLDRLLHDWLSDGPNRAPDQPITAASQFVRSHPRRPDPLRAFRSDPMADRRPRLLGLSPGLVFAVLALVVAVVAVGVVGSQLQKPTVVLPSSDQPSPSATPSTAPSAVTAGPPTPLGSPVVPPVRVQLDSPIGNPTSVDIVDESGLLTQAVSGQGREGNEQLAFDATNDSPTVLRLTWAGGGCDTVHRLTIDPGLTNLTLDRPHCMGDTLGVIRILILTFSRAVDAPGLNTAMHEGRGGVDMPNWTALGPDTAGNAFSVAIFDQSGLLSSLESGSDGGGGTTLAPDTGRAENLAPTTVRLTWARSPCDTDERLVIDEGVTRLTVIGGGCGTGIGALDRQVTFEFSRPVSAAGLTVDVHTASPGPS